MKIIMTTIIMFFSLCITAQTVHMSTEKAERVAKDLKQLQLFKMKVDNLEHLLYSRYQEDSTKAEKTILMQSTIISQQKSIEGLVLTNKVQGEYTSSLVKEKDEMKFEIKKLKSKVKTRNWIIAGSITALVVKVFWLK